MANNNPVVTSLWGWPPGFAMFGGAVFGSGEGLDVDKTGICAAVARAKNDRNAMTCSYVQLTIVGNNGNLF
ncbi:hypothetical protein ACN4DP_02650 [Corynebacterium macclintockiae]|uniref:hypothetical protein n=1 Tax=Corynebacterium macclintockiae TaxID=2913501 RepID=UPI003EB94BD8